jgi:hypothetical protein
VKTIILLVAFVAALSSVKAQTLDPFYAYTFTPDTITNTESDTLLLPADFISPWSYAYHAVMDSLSGTDTLSFVIQESVLRSGNTDWITVATGAGSGSFRTRITGALMYGRRQRIIVNGAGTQSTRYSITFLAKKVFK